jgi:hypothetical protein
VIEDIAEAVAADEADLEAAAGEAIAEVEAEAEAKD